MLPFRSMLVSRRAYTFLLLFGAALAGFSGASTAASAAQDQADEAVDQVRIIEISGLVDPVVADFVVTELDSAEADGALGVLFQLDSKGVVLDDSDFIELARRLDTSPVQIGVWVGPSGSVALGGAAELLGVADIVGVSVGSRVGETGALRLPESQFGEPFGEATDRLRDTSISAPEALELGISNVETDPSCPDIECSLVEVSVLREFLTFFDGYQSPEDTDDPAELTQPRFVQLPLSSQLFHTVASPEVAYLLFVGGLALLIFELYTAGVGIAGVIGAGCLVLGCYGLAVLPTRSWAIAALVAALFCFAVDIQTNIPRLYSAIGMLLFLIGTWFLIDGFRVSWVTMLVGVIGAALYAYTGMPSMVRTRFGSPTIGRSWMIGELGDAVTDVDPEGTVRIREATWRAFTNRATPLSEGDRVRVIGIDRMLLEVEPETGGARDYRERRSSSDNEDYSETPIES